MILSRVADGLYWIGRYLERAENVTRLLLVTEETASEVVGLDEDLARAEWNDLRVIFPGPDREDAPPRYPAALAQAALAELSIDPRHPYSVLFSLKKARDNARTVREALTIEVFVNLKEPKVDLPLFHSRWRSLLRGLSSLENYRRVHGARMEPADALRFLLFDPHTPRSLYFGTAAVKDLLEEISGAAALSAPARIMGKLAAELAYQGEDELRDGRCLPFLDHMLDELTRAHETLSTTYFGT